MVPVQEDSSHGRILARRLSCVVESRGCEMARLTVVLLVGLALTWLAGCGGGEGGTGPVVPPSDDGGSPTQVQIGPLLVRPAAAANFVAQEIPNPNGPISFVALCGSRVTYLASQAMTAASCWAAPRWE